MTEEREAHDDARQRVAAPHLDRDRIAVGHIGWKERQCDPVLEHRGEVAAGHLANDLSVDHHLLFSAWRPPPFSPDAAQLAGDASLLLDRKWTSAAEVVLVPTHHPTETGLERRDARTELMAVQREPGLESEGVARPQPCGRHTGGQHRVPDPDGMLGRHGDLDAVLARVARPRDDAFDSVDYHARDVKPSDRGRVG